MFKGIWDEWESPLMALRKVGCIMDHSGLADVVFVSIVRQKGDPI
jgi:hypothetical protein